MAAASSPHDRETQYQQLLNLLEAPVSERWGLVHMAAFLPRLDLKGPEAESYLLPLVEPLGEMVEGLDPIGCAPQQVEALAAALRSAQAHQPALRSLDDVGMIEEALRRRAALLYAYGGAVARAAACLRPGEGDPIDASPLAASAPRARLAEVRSCTDDVAVEAGLEWVEAHWERGEGAGHAACIPVVERRPSWMRRGADEHRPVGALRQIGVELYGPSDITDRLQVDVIVHGADEVDVTAVPLTAARQLLDDRFPRLRDWYVQGRLAFDRRHLEHGGRSAGLAVAALFYGAVLDHTHRRRRFRLRPPVTLTGSVTEAGVVEAVEASVLPTKVRTVFFSPKTTLVVPEAQEDAATAVRDSLMADFPNGDLTIVGVDRLDGLFYDRRLTEQRRVGWGRYTARRLWHRRGRVVAGTVITALLLIIAALLYGPIDKNPVAVDFAGEEMILKNESGSVLERITVGEQTVQAAQSNAHQAYRLGDIDGNGRNEMCWTRHASGQKGSTPRLQCKGVGEDTLRWTLETNFDVSFPRAPAVTTKGFGANHLRIGDFDANGRPEMIVTLQHNKYFPYLVLKLDAETGREVGRYIHPGYFFSHPLIVDLNADGVNEILLTGVNNAYDQAVFTVLDPRYVDGHGPTRGDYVVEDTEPAREIAYLRIPATVVDSTQPKTVNKGSSLSHYRTRERILVEVWDGRHPGSEKRKSQVLIRMDYDFKPVAIGTASHYDRLADRLAASEEIDKVPDYDYFQWYKRQFQYWTGSGWTKESTINARWQAVAKEWETDSVSVR